MSWQEEYEKLDNDALLYELVCCTNDGYIYTKSELNEKGYYERREAIWAELRKRGLAEKEK